VTAPVFLFTPETIEPADAVASATFGTVLMLTGPEARHAVTVKRLRAQERVDLVDGAGLRLLCEVTGAGVGGAKDRLAVRVLERVEEPEPSLRLTLVQALAKGGRDEQAVETATEVGVGLVLPWQSERCVSVWQGAKQAKGRQRCEGTARPRGGADPRRHGPRDLPPAGPGRRSPGGRRRLRMGVCLLRRRGCGAGPFRGCQWRFRSNGPLGCLVRP